MHFFNLIKSFWEGVHRYQPSASVLRNKEQEKQEQEEEEKKEEEKQHTQLN